MNQSRSKRHAVLPTVGLAGFLAACAMAPVVETPAYKAGYADGCASGRSRGGLPVHYVQDSARMTGDPDYALGWQQAFSMCFIDTMQQEERRRRTD